MKKFKLFPGEAARQNGEPRGDIIYRSDVTNFVADGYAKAKERAGFEPFRAGREAALKSEEGPILENPELTIAQLVEAHADPLSGVSHAALMAALGEIDLVVEDLNTAASKAVIKNKVDSDRSSAERQAGPAIKASTNANANLLQYEIEEQLKPLSLPEGYDRYGTVQKVILKLSIWTLLDAGCYGFTFMPAMPGGMPQALALAAAGSVGMTLCGTLVGTGIRYFNLRKEKGRRRIWRCITLIASMAALLGGIALEQYRSLLEAEANGDATSVSLFSASPSAAGIPVLVTAVLVFTLAVIKFRGGKGSPYARHGDHAMYDRAMRDAHDEISYLIGLYAATAEQIVREEINFLLDANQTEAQRLKGVKAECAKAKAKITALRSSHLAFIRAAEPDIALVRQGILSVRPDIDPDEFEPVTLHGLEAFADPAEVDEAVARADAALAKRTSELAMLELELGELAAQARDDFAKYVTRASRRDETERTGPKRKQIRPPRLRTVQTDGGRS